MKTSTRGMITILAAILFGFAAGICGARLMNSKPHISHSRKEPQALVAEMTRRLKLDSAQAADISDILIRYQGAIDSAWLLVQPSIRSALDSAQIQILDLMTEDQRNDYMAWLRVAHKGVGLKGGPWPEDDKEIK